LANYQEFKLKKIGFVGLGAMGSRMLPHLQKFGYDVIGFDKNPRIDLPRDIKISESISELKNSEILILILPDGSIVREVSIVLANLGFAGLILDMSSSHPNDTIDLQKTLKSYNISVIDAPVSGGVKKAETGSLTIMVGAEENEFTSIKTLLECFGTPVNVGPLGAGHAMKALNNYVSAAGLLASMQALATAETYGIGIEKFTDAINSSTGRNNTTEVKLKPFIASRKYTSGFSLKLMQKDVSIASNIIKNSGFETPLSFQLPLFLDHATKILDDDVDHTGLYEAINPIKKN
jgi:3-hydroxyisobutyrate dehydrogenase